MAFNIRNFADNISSRGSLQTNKFEVVMNPPNIFFDNQIGITAAERTSLLETARNLRFRAESVNIPSVVIDTIETKRYGVGPRQKFGTNSSFSEFSVVFIEEGSNNIYRYFYHWVNSIFDTGGYMNRTEELISGSRRPTYLASYKKDYITDVGVRIFDNRGTERNFVSFIEAFPVSLSDVSLSWGDNNRLFKTSVTFTYTQWKL